MNGSTFRELWDREVKSLGEAEAQGFLPKDERPIVEAFLKAQLWLDMARALRRDPLFGRGSDAVMDWVDESDCWPRPLSPEHEEELRTQLVQEVAVLGDNLIYDMEARELDSTALCRFLEGWAKADLIPALGCVRRLTTYLFGELTKGAFLLDCLDARGRRNDEKSLEIESMRQAHMRARRGRHLLPSPTGEGDARDDDEPADDAGIIPTPIDGCYPPRHVGWKGKSLKVGPTVWRLLKFMWGKEPQQAESVSEAVWDAKDGGATVDAMKSAVTRANYALAFLATPFQITQENGYICWVSGQTGVTPR